MATNIKTVKTYQLNGATTDFAIPFEYLARKFVQVSLIGVDRKVLILNQDYRFATKALISTTRAWGPADGYYLIEIRRYTSATERLVDFTDGSILRAYDLNISQVQTLHVAEEARDLTADTIGVNNDGHLDARGRRIVNVTDAKDPGDAITLGQVQKWNESALNSKNAAKVSENNAKVSENASKTSENNSKASENSAAASRDLAHKWAQNPFNVPVTGSEYSAYHYSVHALNYANNSGASASASAASASAALNSQNAAKVSEDSARDDAARAKFEADKLENNNTLAAAVESVDPAGQFVNWRYNQTAPSASYRNGISVGRGAPDGHQAFFNFYYANNLGGTIDVQPNGLSVRNCENFSINSTLWNNTPNRITKQGYLTEGNRKVNYGVMHTIDNWYCVQKFSEVSGQYLAYNISLTGGGNYFDIELRSNGVVEISHPTQAYVQLRGDGRLDHDGNLYGTRWGSNGNRDYLSNFLGANTIQDIYIGAARSVGLGGKAGDIWADGGGFIKGIRQDLGGAELFIGAVHMASIWKKYNNGQAYIIAG